MDVGLAFGLTHGERGPGFLEPCPACGASKRHPSRRDRRGALGLTRDGGGWRCHECNASGDGVALAAWLSVGKVPGKGDPAWADVRRDCAAHGLCSPDTRDGRPAAPVPRRPPPPPRPPEALQRLPLAEVEALWSASAPASSVSSSSSNPADRDAARFLAVRFGAEAAGDLAELDLARVLPLAGAATFPAWWPEAWASTWRLAVLAYEADGTVAGLHARAVRQLDGDAPKNRWPKGEGIYSFSGLLFADVWGRALLQGHPPGGLEGVLVTEGLTDLLAASLWCARSSRAFAVLGATSGGFGALARVRWPAGLPCYVATDGDEAGERYAAEVRAVLPRAVRVLRVRFGGGKGMVET